MFKPLLPYMLLLGAKEKKISNHCCLICYYWELKKKNYQTTVALSVIIGCLKKKTVRPLMPYLLLLGTSQRSALLLAQRPTMSSSDTDPNDSSAFWPGEAPRHGVQTLRHKYGHWQYHTTSTVLLKSGFGSLRFPEPKRRHCFPRLLLSEPWWVFNCLVWFLLFKLPVVLARF